jgi:hypothetical protein
MRLSLSRVDLRHLLFWLKKNNFGIVHLIMNTAMAKNNWLLRLHNTELNVAYIPD